MKAQPLALTPTNPPAGRRALWAWTLLVLVLHLAVLSGLDSDALLSPSTPPVLRPMQARALLTPASPEARPATRPASPSQRPRATPHRPIAQSTPPSESPAASATPPVVPSSAILAPSPVLEPLATVAAAEAPSPPASAPAAPPESSASRAASPGTASPSATTPPPTHSPWPLRLGTLPPSSLTRYQLTGMDRGMTYYADGELRWQHGPDAYALSLVVKAFLIGSRQWQSVGRIGAQGLQPLKFSDKAKQERAVHIDREGGRIVFSGSTQGAEPQPGLQDQLSLYLQLATALGGELGQRPAGTRLEVQTLTARDAQPWTLVSEGEVRLDWDGRSLRTQKWSAQPRGRYDSRLDIWAAADQGWMPVRIRISQFNGSYIDLLMKDRESLPDLSAVGGSAQKTTSP